MYQLLGGASRDAVLVYGHASGANVDETVAAAASYVSRGYKAVRAQCSVPGLAQTYGIGKEGMRTSRPSAGSLSGDDLEQRALSAVRRRRCSSACGASSGPTCTCCTTCTIG